MIEALCVGHACVDMNVHVPVFPKENGKQEIHGLFESGGGPAANAAYLLSSWGVPTAFAGLIGDDARGRQVMDEFMQVGTDLSMLEVRKGYETPFSVILVNEQNGSRTIVNRKQGQAHLDGRTMTKVPFNPRVILMDGHEPEASLMSMTLFPGAKTVLDAGSLREGTRLLMGQVDYLVCSERFALAATGVAGLDNVSGQGQCLSELRKMVKGQIVVTMGDRGLIYDNQGVTIHMPAHAVKTIDTTAAGDIFHGAFTYGLLQGLEWTEILKLASATAALSVQVAGGRQSIPKLQDVLSFFNQETAL